jgi:MFS family permease
MASNGSPPISAPARPLPWWRELTRYHWFVLVVASLGWLFDTMDQQLFNLARKPAITALLRTEPGDPRIDEYGPYTTSIFIMGWALGGLVFGILGDRIGRVKTMLLTILLYSLFTGLSAFSYGVADFTCYRFLTGLGVGGEFAVGVALVAETMPDRARPHALGWLQAFSAFGNMMAAVTGLVLSQFEQRGVLSPQWGAWRVMFLIGILPALLALPIMRRLKEPERWKAAATKEGMGQQLGSIKELFGTPLWRRHAIVGMLLAFAGVVGLWGIGFFSFDLIRSVFRQSFEAEGVPAEEIAGKLTFWASMASLLQNFGSFLGVYAFSRFTQWAGRKPAFAIGFILAPISTAFTFWFLRDWVDVLWMIPIMGFCQLTVFGGYAIYFPELFPTRLRSTGTSFCYNVGRFVAALGPLSLGLLAKHVFADYGEVLRLRYAGVTMCAFFFIGLAVLPFAPETKGKPLPE